MGFIYTTQIQNQPYPHANLSMLPYLLFHFIVTIRCRGSQKAFGAKWLPSGHLTFNINDVLNKNKNKPNEPVATVPKKDFVILLPYVGLHSNHITKRLKSCVNRFYCSVLMSELFFKTPGASNPSSHTRTVSTDHNCPKSFIKLVAGAVQIFTLGKRSEDFTTGKRNISRLF